MLNQLYLASEGYIRQEVRDRGSEVRKSSNLCLFISKNKFFSLFDQVYLGTFLVFRFRFPLTLTFDPFFQLDGTMTPEVEARIRNLSIEQLENLGEVLLDFSDAADLVTWLEREAA